MTPDEIVEQSLIETSKLQRANHNAIQFGNDVRREGQLAVKRIDKQMKRIGCPALTVRRGL